MTIAREISHRIKYELGVTVSIGISWNKIYAKLGSDYKKPDAITELGRENYKDSCFCSHYNKTDVEVQQELGIGRTSFYKMKKQALGYLGFYFYEIVVPQAKDKRFKPSLGVEEE